MINVRKFNLNDIDFIVDNWLGTDRLDGVFKEDSIEKIQEKFYQWEKEKDENGRAYIGFAIELGDKLIGLLWFTENVKGELTFSLYLDMDYRRKGYGTEAYRMIESFLKDKGFKIIKSSCRQDNEASVKLHKKLNFSLIKQEHSPNGTPMYRWEKKLN